MVCGPGSKALLFGLLLAIGADVAVPQPSWVSYAAQASMLGVAPHFVPVPPGEGGVCDAAGLAATVTAARAAGRRIGAVVLTLPDNPTGRLARPASVHALCQVAAEHDLIIIADEIYRDLVHDPGHAFASPVLFAPERTVVTTALSKSLALGGWRIGVARLPGSPIGLALRDRLVGIGSEIGPPRRGRSSRPQPSPSMSRPSFSNGYPAAVPCTRKWPPAWPTGSRRPGCSSARRRPRSTSIPTSRPGAEHLRATRGISNGADLATHLLHCYGVGVLPASAFGEEPEVLRVRVATAMLYGETDAQRERALLSDDPVTLPWIAAALDRIEDVLADLAP